jgi:hypothetical protein
MTSAVGQPSGEVSSRPAQGAAAPCGFRRTVMLGQDFSDCLQKKKR